jgi:hypothetical protein
VSFGTVADHVQFGLTIAGGVGELDGTLIQRTVALPGLTQTITTVDAEELFAPGGTRWPVVPLGRLTFNVAGVLTNSLKVRAGGGFNMPGYEIFDIGVVYLFGR